MCGISVCSLRVSESVYIESVVSERKHNQVGGGRMGCGGGEHRHRVRRPDLAPSTPPPHDLPVHRLVIRLYPSWQDFLQGEGAEGWLTQGDRSRSRSTRRHGGRSAGVAEERGSRPPLLLLPQSLRSIDKETSLWNDTSRCSLVRCSSTDYTRLYFYDDSL